MPDFSLFAPIALLPEGWTADVRVSVAGGRIRAVERGAAPRAEDERLEGAALLPAVANLHSHAFQRAMAGMTERRGPEADSFWTWRALMYRFLDVLGPDEIEAIAALAYVEMLEAGFAAVAEFHYLHHQPGGVPYANPAELSHRIAAAADAAGIGLTLLPVLYGRGGLQGAPLAGGQQRFGNGMDAFLRLVDAARPALAAEDAVMGAAAHSLRAVTLEEIAALAEALPRGPLHIHAAEQVREVEEVTAALGARPVEVLLERIGIGPRWCLIHATHMSPREIEGLARAGATAGLCPITEANLGDGIFAGAAFRAAGGRFGIGSDSNVRISLAGELAMLEYGQRLRDRARNVMADADASTGECLYRAALAGGGAALARDCGAIRPGLLADLVAIDREAVALAPLADDALLDGWIFAAGDGVVRAVWSAGRAMVRQGRHVARERIEARYRASMRAVRARL